MTTYTQEDLNELKSDYYQSLQELNTTELTIIKTLTEIAEESKDGAAEVIVEAVEQRIREAPPKEILPALYLLDSICKTVRKPYIELFSQNLITTFTSSYEKITDAKTRISLLKLLKTWAQIFPPDLVWKVEQRMRARYKVHKELEPQIGPRFSQKISVNPDFFQRPSNVPMKIMSQKPVVVKREKKSPVRLQNGGAMNKTPPPPHIMEQAPSWDSMQGYNAPPPMVDQQYSPPGGFGGPPPGAWNAPPPGGFAPPFGPPPPGMAPQQPPPGGFGPPQQPPPSGFGGPPQQPPPGWSGPPPGGYGMPPQQPPPGAFGPPQQPPPGGFGGPPQQPGFPPAMGGYGAPQQPAPGVFLPPQQPGPGGLPPQQPGPADVNSIFDALNFGNDDLFASSLDQNKHAQTIFQLYDAFKLKCNICGLRFHIQVKLDEHLDRHIERNQDAKKILARRWFQDELDWDKEIVQDPMESPQAIAFGQMSNHSVDKKRKHSEISSAEDDEEAQQSVPEDEDQEACPICHEAFRKFFDENRQEWMYGEATRDNELESENYDKIVHVACLNFQRSSEAQSPGSPATKRLRPNEMFS